MAYKENYPSKLLENAVDAISSLPGVGRRSALRLALHLLKQPQENVRHFAQAVTELRESVKYCSECMMISDDQRAGGRMTGYPRYLFLNHMQKKKGVSYVL